MELRVQNNEAEPGQKITYNIATGFSSVWLINTLTKIDEETNKVMAEKLNLKALREFQEKFPMCHAGGSLGLFLHGIRLERFNNANGSDFDLVIPYFHLFESVEGFTINWEDAKASGNDFDETFICVTKNGQFKVDIKIDPKQRYEIIEYQGFKYKVSKLECILEAKIRYALGKFGKKHLQDIYEMTGKTRWTALLDKKLVKETDDLPW